MTSTITPAPFKARVKNSPGRWNVTSHDTESAARYHVFNYLNSRRNAVGEVWRHEVTPLRTGYALLTQVTKGTARRPAHKVPPYDLADAR